MSRNYTIAEVAEKVRVSERTVLREIKRGKLKTNKAGRRYLITQSQLDDYVGTGEPDVSLALDTYLHEKKSEMVSMVQHLVSYGDSPDPVAKRVSYLRSKLMKYGFRVHMHRGTQSILRVSYGYKASGVLLRAPVDIHPAGDAGAWKYSPYEGIVKHDRMYGRGVLDGISGAVAAVYSLRALKKYVPEDTVRVEVVFDSGVVMGDFDSIVDLVSRGLPVDGGMSCVGGEAGVLGLGVRGEWHGVVRSQGKDPIYSIARALGKLTDDDIKLISIVGGNAAEQFDSCKAEFVLTTGAKLGRADAKQIVSRRVKGSDISFSILSGYSGYQIPKDDSFVRIMRDAAEVKGVSEIATEIRDTGTGEGIYAGHGIPLVNFGPSGGNSRSYDEYVDLNSIPQTAAIYADVIVRHFA